MKTSLRFTWPAPSMLIKLTSKFAESESGLEEFKREGVSGANSLVATFPTPGLGWAVSSPLAVRFVCARWSPRS